MTTTTDTKSTWSLIYSALAEAYPDLKSNDQTLFQYVAFPTGATWSDGVKDYTAYQAASNGAANLSGFYAPGSDLFEAYSTYVRSLKVPNMANNPDYQQLMQQININITETATLDQKESDAYDYYTTTHPNLPLTFEDWEKRWGSSFLAKKKQLDSENELLNKRKGEMMDSSDAFKTKPMDKINSANILYKNNTTAPNIEISPSLDALKANWIGYGKDQHDLSIKISKDQTASTGWQVITKTSTSTSCCHAEVKVENEFAKWTSDENFTVTVNFRGVGTFTINRPWLDSTLLAHPLELEPTCPLQADDFFGARGSLKLVPTQFVVVFRPSILCTVSKTVYEETRKTWFDGSFSGFSLFGMDLSSNVGSKLENVKVVSETGNVTTFEVPENPNDTIPRIFAVVSQNFWNGKGSLNAVSRGERVNMRPVALNRSLVQNMTMVGTSQ